MDLSSLTSNAKEGISLTLEQAQEAALAMTLAEAPPGEKADFLTALAAKGETAEEIAGFVQKFRDLARDPGLSEWSDRAIDVCGTGGDKLGSFNISTTVTFCLAALDVPILKHGNRSITSKCGSANLLEALGVKIDAPNEILQKAMQELGFCFMFAPAFHPAFKEIMPVRQLLAERGQRTVFNILGPLINPARPAYQLLGVFGSQVMELMAAALSQVGLKAGFVVHCELEDGRGMDELSVAGANIARGFGALSNESGRWKAEELGLASGNAEDLLGGDVEQNVSILDSLLDGKAPKALEDTVVLNVAAALRVIGRAASIQEGLGVAREALLGGATRQKIMDTRAFYASL